MKKIETKSHFLDRRNNAKGGGEGNIYHGSGINQLLKHPRVFQLYLYFD